MHFRQLIFSAALSFGLVTVSFSQVNYNIRNGIGVGGGFSIYDIKTDNFETQSGNGRIAGMLATVDIPHKWYTVSYGMQLSQNNLEIMGSSPTSLNEPIEYNLLAIQAQFLFHAKIAKDYFMLDVGPMLQYNGELDLKNSTQENFVLNGFNSLLAKDISDISKFNVNVGAGASVGFDRFKIRVQYIYGLTNMFNKLNDQDLDSTPNSDAFKGNQSMLAFMAFIYL